jgi:uncharacterized protein (DUF362 family)/ferredoxin
VEFKKYDFESAPVCVVEGLRSREDLKSFSSDILAMYQDLLPLIQDTPILLKPNLNNDLTALTGNSVDLRFLAALVGTLRGKGYENIWIGDGPNLGVHRLGIDVFARLGVRALADRLGVRLVDFNREPGVEIGPGPDLARIAEVILKVPLMVNIGKIKTHAEAVLSLACKNLIGCLVGSEKRWAHWDLPGRIVDLVQEIRPRLHLIDGLIAMEGNGPGDGIPRWLGLALAGTDPFLLDGVAARLCGYEAEEVPYLREARRRGLISRGDWLLLGKIETRHRLLRAPERSPVARVLGDVRVAPLRDLLRFGISRRPVPDLLYRLRLIQDLYETDDGAIESIPFHPERCTRCGLCRIYCPMGIEPDREEDRRMEEGCLRCLYCCFVCPEEAFELVGDLGYLRRHLEKYGEEMRGVGGEKP